MAVEHTHSTSCVIWLAAFVPYAALKHQQLRVVAVVFARINQKQPNPSVVCKVEQWLLHAHTSHHESFWHLCRAKGLQWASDVLAWFAWTGMVLSLSLNGLGMSIIHLCDTVALPTQLPHAVCV